MKALFIINPSSGRQNFIKGIEEIVSKLILDQIVPHIDVVYTQKQDDAYEAAYHVKPGEYDFITAVGGDGTLNEVVNGIIKGGHHTPMAVISAGTVNDFATYLNLPQTAEEFCEMIANFRCKDVDVGKVNDQYFMNVLAGGLLTDVGYKVPKELKALFGKIAYYVEGAMDIPRQVFNTMSLKFTSEEYTKETEVIMFIVANSQSVGGLKNVAPLASVSDGLLDVLVLRKVDVGQISNLLLKLLQGDHLNHPSVDYFQTKKIKIEPLNDMEIPVDYDGECFGEIPVEVEVIEKALKVIIPKKKI